MMLTDCQLMQPYMTPLTRVIPVGWMHYFPINSLDPTDGDLHRLPTFVIFNSKQAYIKRNMNE